MKSKNLIQFAMFVLIVGFGVLTARDSIAKKKSKTSSSQQLSTQTKTLDPSAQGVGSNSATTCDDNKEYCCGGCYAPTSCFNMKKNSSCNN